MKKPLIFYGWVIVAVGFTALAFAYGVRFSFSVFYRAILDEFGWSRADTALIFSINIIVYGVTAPLAGALVDRFGPRKVIPAFALVLAAATAASSQAQAIWHLYILYGVILAFATSCVGSVPHVALLSNWFVKKRATAFGLLLAANAGAFILASVVEYFIINLGWRPAFLILGAMIVVIVVPLVTLFERRRPEEMGLLPDGAVEESAGGWSKKTQQEGELLVRDPQWTAVTWTLWRAMKPRRLWLLFFANFFFYGIGVYMVRAHQVVFATDLHYDPMVAAFIFSLTGVLSAAGAASGFISDRLGREETFAIAVVFTTIGGILLLLTKDNASPWMLYLHAITLGFGYGLGMPTLVAAGADLFQGKSFGAINGFIMMGFGIGGFVGPWLGGKIHDVTGSYTWAFMLVIGGMLFSYLLVFLSSPRKVRVVVGKVARKGR